MSSFKSVLPSDSASVHYVNPIISCTKHPLTKISVVVLGILLAGGGLALYFAGPQLLPTVFSIARHQIIAVASLGGTGLVFVLAGLVSLLATKKPLNPTENVSKEIAAGLSVEDANVEEVKSAWWMPSDKVKTTFQETLQKIQDAEKESASLLSRINNMKTPNPPQPHSEPSPVDTKEVQKELEAGFKNTLEKLELLKQSLNTQIQTLCLNFLTKNTQFHAKAYVECLDTIFLWTVGDTVFEGIVSFRQEKETIVNKLDNPYQVNNGEALAEVLSQKITNDIWPKNTPTKVSTLNNIYNHYQELLNNANAVGTTE